MFVSYLQFDPKTRFNCVSNFLQLVSQCKHYNCKIKITMMKPIETPKMEKKVEAFIFSAKKTTLYSLLPSFEMTPGQQEFAVHFC